MAIRRFSNTGILGTKSSKLWDQLTFGSYFESIATIVVPSGGLSTVAFTNIPQIYSHLQIRAITRNSGNVGGDDLQLRLNNDSGSFYTDHQVYANGTNVQVRYEAPTGMTIAHNTADASYSASIFNAAIIDILDYTNTNKYKTVRCIWGADNNNASPAGYCGLNSGLYTKTSAITQVNLYSYNYGSNNIAQYSSFALYGIRGS